MNTNQLLSTFEEWYWALKVVKANNGDIVRDREIQLAQSVVGPHRHTVVVAEQRGRSVWLLH